MSRAHTTSHLAAVSVDVLEKRGPETKTLRSGLAAHWHYGLAGEQPELLREETSLRNFKLELDSQTSLQVGHCWIKCSATKIRDLRPGSLPHCLTALKGHAFKFYHALRLATCTVHWHVLDWVT